MGRLRFLVIDNEASDCEEAIRICGEALMREGYVGETFLQGCLKRERDYPTGIPSEIPVAMPHCRDSSVRKGAICLLRLKKPVKFRRIDDDKQWIQTDMVFNLATSESEDYMEVLKRFSGFLTNTKTLKECRELPAEEARDLLEKNMGSFSIAESNAESRELQRGQSREKTMKKHLIRILIACGSGIATSSIAADVVEEIARKENIRVDIIKGTIPQIQAKQYEVDLVLTTARYQKPVDKPFLCVMGFVSGVGEEEQRAQLSEMLRKIQSGEL